MGPKLLEQAKCASDARDWYTGKERGRELYKETNELAQNLAEHGPEPDDAESQPLAIVLAELEMEAGEAFENLDDLSKYKKGQSLKVTDRFLERALIWQIESGLGMTLDAMLGRDALVRMGLDPGSGGEDGFAVWNVDNQERREADPVLESFLDEGTFLSAVVDTLTLTERDENGELTGSDKKTGDLTSDDGVAFGVAHFTNPTDLLEFIELVGQWDEKPAEKETSEVGGEPKSKRTGQEILERIFGTSDIDELKKDLLLDIEWSARNNTYMAALVEAGKIEMLIEFLRDPQVKPLQFEMLRVEVGADIQTHQGRFGGKADLTVGSAALIACLGNSSSNGLDKVGSTHIIKDAQKQAGELYLSGGSEEDGYKIVAKAIWIEGFTKMLDGHHVTQNYSPEEWEKKINDLLNAKLVSLSEKKKATAISKKGPLHRLRRLLHLLNAFGEHWGDSYSQTESKL